MNVAASDEELDLERRVRDVEVTLWGVDRTNGMRSSLRGFQTALEKLDAKIVALDEKIDQRDADALQERRTWIRWSIASVLAFLTVLAAGLGAVLSATGHG